MHFEKFNKSFVEKYQADIKNIKRQKKNIHKMPHDNENSGHD